MAGRQLARHLRNILIRWWHISTRDDVKRKEPQGGSGVTTSADDEETFVLCDEIIDRIYGFFPPPDDHHDRIYQACRALQALGACHVRHRTDSLHLNEFTENPEPRCAYLLRRSYAEPLALLLVCLKLTMPVGVGSTMLLSRAAHSSSA